MTVDSDVQSRITETLRVSIEVVTVSGTAAAVVFQVRPELVEVWRHEGCSAVFDRHRLRAWLADPVHPLVNDDVTITLDRAVDSQGRVAITLPDVRAWTLSPTERQTLTESV